jgi:hypothetical protein
MILSVKIKIFSQKLFRQNVFSLRGNYIYVIVNNMSKCPNGIQHTIDNDFRIIKQIFLLSKSPNGLIKSDSNVKFVCKIILSPLLY